MLGSNATLGCDCINQYYQSNRKIVLEYGTTRELSL